MRIDVVRNKMQSGWMMLSIWGVLCVLLLPLPSLASDETPPTIPGAKTVTAGEVQQLITQGAKVFDLRKKAAYVEKHIVTATHIGYDEKSAKSASFDASVDRFDLDRLPQDKNAKLVFYGHGPDGWKAYKGAVLAIKAGYKNVYFFRSGFSEWTSKGLPSE